MASRSERDLLSKLESSTSTPIFSLYSDFLCPFSDLTNLKPKHKPKAETQARTLVRSLAKQFLSFLNCSLSVLPKRLSDPSKLLPREGEPPKLALELFDTYKLCLDCLESVSSQLSCKPYTVYLQRARLMYCLDAWGLYREAEDEGFGVLERLRVLESGQPGKFVPRAVENMDAELGRLVVEVVAGIVKCVASRHSKDGGDYMRVLELVEEVQPWLRVLDCSIYEKLHKLLVTYLGKCALYLIGEPMGFSAEMVHTFSLTTLNEYAKSPIKYQIYKFARRIFSSLFLLLDDRPSVVILMLKYILDFLAKKCKTEMEYWETEFVELVSYCANKCRNATDFAITVAEFLNNLAGKFSQAVSPLGLILRLYATGLSFSASLKSRVDVTSSNGTEDEPLAGILMDDRVGLCNLAPLLVSLRCYTHDNSLGNFLSRAVGFKDSPDQIFSNSHKKLPSNCPPQSSVYLPLYVNVLKFLCQPLEELVNSKKKEIIVDNQDASVITALFGIQEAFDELCDTFLLLYSSKAEKDEDEFDAGKIVLHVAIASFTLSIRTKCHLQKNVDLIKIIISSEWIQPQGLKYIFASLYNIGVLLHRNGRVNEASKALKLCCKASWTCLITLCQMLVNQSNGSMSDLSEDDILDFFHEACTRTASLLEVLHQRGIVKVKKIILLSVESWSVAEDLLRSLPGPMPLVKQWVKVVCHLNENVGGENSGPTLFSMLSSSLKVTKRALGKILQQELLSYERMDAQHPEFCRIMQLKIVDILLKDVYADQDNCLQKSIILIKKAWAVRAGSIDSLRECIQILSEAISLKDGVTCGSGSASCHQLVMAYCLRALSYQEVEPNSKKVLQDIGAAINIWLSIPDTYYGCAYDGESLFSGSSLLILYNIIDLSLIKGSMEFHNDMCKLVFKIFKWKNVSLEKCISILWDSKRLSHALCASPVDYTFLMNLTENFGESCKSLEFWTNCLKGSTTSIVGFQQNFPFLFGSVHCGSQNHEAPFQLDLSVDDVKEAASELVSCVPTISHSLFLAGYLYYDLSKRLVASGCLFEALLHAKEAHRLRTKLFQEKFTYSVEHQIEKQPEPVDHFQKLTYSLRNLQLRRAVARQMWSFDKVLWDKEACYLSPWKVLQSYLESTLQVGVIHEMIGNGVEAETFLLWGKDISYSQSLPLFMVSFSSVLGKLYHRKRCWDLSEKELKSAQQILGHNCNTLSCSKCRLILQVTVEQQLGDLYRSHRFSATKVVSLEEMRAFENLQRSALEKLNSSIWKNSISCPEEMDAGSGNAFTCSFFSETSSEHLISAKAGNKGKTEVRNSRKLKNAPKSSFPELLSATTHNSRITRSNYRSQKQDSEGTKTTCICNKMYCWLCLAKEVRESGLLSNSIHLKWEILRRQLSMRVLSSIGKCLGLQEQIHEAHKIMFQSISLLVGRNAFSYTPVPLSLLLNLVGKVSSWDVFTVERAAIIYDICWSTLRSYSAKSTRTICCDLSSVKLPNVVSWLMLAFILCREVPVLFQKVSRLLSVIFILSSSSYLQPLRSYCKSLSESHWASFFHQASIGTHLNCQFFLDVTGGSKARHDIGDKCTPGEDSVGSAEAYKLPGIAPESLQDMEKFVTNFFSDLPCTPIICISVIGGQCGSFIQDTLKYPSFIDSWIMLSRLNAKYEPVVMLLPLDSVLEENLSEASEEVGAMFELGECSESDDLNKRWQCPWGFTVVDEVAPPFKVILEENYLSSSIFPLEDTKKNRTLWWMRRKKLDSRLGEFLRKLEDLWFGPWKCILLGEQSNCKHLDSVVKNLAHNLKSKCKVDINESLLKVILGGARCASDVEACVSGSLSLRKGCVIGKAINSNEEMCETLPEESGLETLSALVVQLLNQYAIELVEEDSTFREPVILVPDYDVQMLPWENLPTLRNQELYRMPSVGSICLAFDRNCPRQQEVALRSAFPSIDPLDAFYLINPSGDLTSTQVEFEDWFRDQNLEGKAGMEPTAEELASALTSHDLFIYFGHGSGTQYIPCQEIQKLENCAASLLMGCSSGSLSLNGRYVPQGAPLAYLLAGSPVIVANLWEVTDRDIDRFGKAMLEAWLNERSGASSCAQCDSVTKELEAMNIKGGGKGNSKRKVTKKKIDSGVNNGGCCSHRPKIGSFMSQARDACTLPYLIGASPVCYGVPTGIRRKDL